MMECEHEEVEMNRVPVTKRNGAEAGDTAKKKMKTLSPPDDRNECLADVESNCAVVCDAQASSDATDSHAVSDTETGDSVRQEQGPKLSKRQIKKEKKRELYRAGLALKRAREKEKRRQKKLEARLNCVDLGPSRKELKQSTMANSKCKMRVAIDMSFDHLMNEKDLGKCVKQLLRCYSANRRAQNPIQLYITSFKGKTKEAMAKHTGYQNWDVYFQPESYLNLFDHKDIVYLTSESKNILQEMQDDKAYIIGGLVDHNSQKGVTLAIAEEKCLHHAQLPIENFLEMKTRKVLSIVHVFEIMLLVREGMSWKDALLHVMPARKGAAEKSVPVSAIAECSSQEMEHTRNQMSDLQSSDKVPAPTDTTEHNK